MTIDDVIDQLFETNNLDRVDIGRMVKSQFRVVSSTIRSKGDKTCNLIFVGKFKPTPYRIKQLKGLV